MSYVQSAGYLSINAISQEHPERLGLAAIAVMGLGIATSIPMQGIGKLYVGEVLMAAIALYAWFQLLSAPPKYRQLAYRFQVMFVLSLLGYVVSDIYRGIPAADYVRGWSRWGVMISNFVCLCWLASKSWGHLWQFAVGWQVGHALLPFIQGFAGQNFGYLWKFYFAFPLLVLMLFLLRKRSPKTLTAALIGFGVLSVALDFRSIALVCWLTAAITFLSDRRLTQRTWNLKKSTMIKAVASLLLVAMVAVWAVQSLGAKYGYTERFYRSNMKRITFAKVTIEGIRQSPMIGYGSWAKNAELRKIRDRLIKKSGQDKVFREAHDKDLVIAHSQLLQGWLEGGILGVLFFVFFGYQLLRKSIYLIAERPYAMYMPMVILFCINASWHLVFSPFKGTQRIFIAIAAVAICYLGQEIATARQAKQFYRTYGM